MSRSPLTRLTLYGLVVLFASLLMAGSCEKAREFDKQSGGDDTRKSAKKLFFGQNVTDSIDDPQGDNTDWKEIRVREPGTMGVTISIDNPRQMHGEISIHDGFGTELERRPIAVTDNIYTFDRIPVYQGDYYVKVFVDRGASVYTAGARFEGELKANITPPIETDEPDPIKRGGGGRGNGGGGATKDPEPKEVVVEKVEPVDPPVEDESQFLSINGRIARFVPMDEGGTMLTIAGFGSDDGVTAGMSGTIVGLGQSFRVTRVSRKSSFGVTKAEAEQLQPYKVVVVRVKKK